MKIPAMIFASCSILYAAELDSDEIQAQKDGLAYWSQLADRAASLPEDEMIERLSSGLFKTTLTPIFTGVPERSEVANKLKMTLLSIPGHAKFYQDKIERLRAQALVDAKRSDAEIMRMRADHTMVEFGDYERFREDAFTVLALLPSSETVEVLSHFLDDPEGMKKRHLSDDERSGGDYRPFPTNARASAIALSKLGIENAPVQMAGNRDFYDFAPTEELDAWKAWWSNVKEGKRTYRFIGSNVEYGPDGPVSTVKQRRQEMPGSSIGESTSNSTRSTTVPWILAILATCVACVVAAWCIIRMRSRRV
jgi:hypothetical protein